VAAGFISPARPVKISPAKVVILRVGGAYVPRSRHSPERAMTPDPVVLSRIQFDFTVSAHIMVPAFTVGQADRMVP
jgi:hypothetical protein